MMKVPLLLSVVLILSLIGRCDAIRITRIKVPGRSSNATNISTSCDLPVGCTITVECDDPSQTLRYDTHVLAQRSRFDDVRVYHVNGSNNWKLSDLRSYDTGMLTCSHNSSHDNNTYGNGGHDSIGQTGSETSSLYIFVNNASELYVPLKKQVFYKHFLGSYFPCLTTDSRANVTLTLGPNQYSKTAKSNLDLVQGVDYTIDKQRGVRFLQIPSSEADYIFTFSLGESTQQQSYFLYIVDLDHLPEPVFEPTDNRHHYLVGENLTMTCYIMFDDIESVIYKYPGSSCPYDTIDALGCDKPRDKGRVAMSRFQKESAKKVVSVFTVTSLRVEDSGMYTCLYKIYDDDTYRRRAEQNIYVVETELINVTAVQSTVTGLEHDDTLTLTSRVEALTPPLITWKFNSVDIEMGAKYSISRSELEEALYEVNLVVRSLSLFDAGQYVMTASINTTALATAFTVKVNAPPKMTLFYTYNNHTIPVTGEIKTVYSKLNHTLTVDCKTIGGSPPPEVTWYWQNCDYERACDMDDNSWVLINSTARGVENQPYIHTTNPGRGKLRLTTQRSGWLRCSGSNVVTESSETLRLAVSELTEDYEGIGFSGNTKKVAAQLVEGDVIVLPCVVSRFSCAEDNVQIIRSSHEVYDRKSDHILDWNVGTDSYRLSISLNASVNMNGHKYACRCKHGRQGPVVTLEVKEYVAPTWMKRVSGETEMTSGQTYTMICRAAGTPLPTISWYRDGQLLRPTDTTLISKDRYNLTLIRVSPTDSGEYSCKAKVTGRSSVPLQSSSTLTVIEDYKMTSTQVAVVIVIAVITCLTAVIVSFLVVRKFCRKKYVPHILLLPSKDTINPDLPIDEQTDALPYDQKWEFPFKNLKLGMLLGQGAFGRVLKAQAMNIEEGVTSTTVAVKAVRDPEDGKQIKSLISELKILIHIGQHLNILNLLGACTKGIRKGHILVIVEYCKFGNLRNYLLEHKDYFVPSLQPANMTKKHFSCPNSGDEDYLNAAPLEIHSKDNPVTLRDVFSWSYQIARGMEYLASINYIHRDLAARNVLLANDNVVKICDFGLSKDIYKYQEYQKTTQGPLPVKWMALESLTHKVFNVRTDVWAYGVTIWELFSLAATPYPGWEIDDTFINKLQNGYRMEKPEHCPQDLYEDVLLRCWNMEPTGRPSFTDLAGVMSEKIGSPLVEHLHHLEESYKQGQGCSRWGRKTELLKKLYLKERANVKVAGDTRYDSLMPSPGSTGNKVENNEPVDLPAGRAPSPPPMAASSPHTFPECNCSEHSSPGNSPNIVNTSGPPSYSYVMDRKSSSSTHSDTCSTDSSRERINFHNVNSFDNCLYSNSLDQHRTSNSSQPIGQYDEHTKNSGGELESSPLLSQIDVAKISDNNNIALVTQDTLV